MRVTQEVKTAAIVPADLLSYPLCFFPVDLKLHP